MEKTLRALLKKYPVATLTGPRQSGKTTLSRRVFAGKPYVNLEAPNVRRFAQEDPEAFLAENKDGAVFDEIQNTPELLSYLMPIVDDSPRTGRFILTGSRQFPLMEGVSQSLAGRTAILRLLPFSLDEIKDARPNFSTDDWLFTGFYPRIYEAGLDPSQAHADYYATCVERDIRQLANLKNLTLFDRFVRLCAGRVGQVLNLNNLASDTGISHPTAREWFSLLEAAFIVCAMPPFFSNVSKRLTKSPKLYFYDTGLAVWLCGVTDVRQLAAHPLRGAFFENMAVGEVIKHNYNHALNRQIHFYRDSNCEVDLLWLAGGKLIPVEIKSAQTFSTDYGKGIRYFRREFPALCHESAIVVYDGTVSRKTSDGIHYCPLGKLATTLLRLDKQDG
ncbi:MAG: ATP-binding protein [Puniceicoccales bacterium]|nr:ATP-binding protein [Puniceicoccales bacterium]